jgi:uncharacterized membrane protein YfcA
MDINTLLFLIALFVVATLFSSVGHGGASGYLALMGLFHFAPEVMRPSALVLNVVVSLIAAWQYSGTEKFDNRLLFALVASSIPAAFVGATISIDATVYKVILGVIILIQALNLIFFFKMTSVQVKKPPLLLIVIAGMAIGLLSGLIGIGGGILLSPLLLLMGWATIKQTAFISAIFIFLNSLAGIAGLLYNKANFDSVLYLWIGVVIVGGFVGSRMGSRVLPVSFLRKILGVVLLIAGVKLILQ